VAVSPSALENVTTYIAEEAGFFKNHCLELRFLPVERTSAGFAHALTGTLDVSHASVGVVTVSSSRLRWSSAGRARRVCRRARA
jgi:hypothetical protein